MENTFVALLKYLAKYLIGLGLAVTGGFVGETAPLSGLAFLFASIPLLPRISDILINNVGFFQNRTYRYAFVIGLTIFGILTLPKF